LTHWFFQKSFIIQEFFMKKFLVLILVLGFAAIVFVPESSAEVYWGLDTDFNTGLFTRGIPAGERAEKLITLDNLKVPNNNINNPFTGRGDYTFTPGYMDLFSYGSGRWLRGNELRMTIGYRTNGIEIHTMALLDSLVRADQSDGTGIPHELGPDHSLVQTPNGIRNVNWGDFLRYSFEEYYFKGNVGAFSGYVGNTPDRGKVNNFNTFTDDVLRTIRVENYGVITPDVNADFLNDGQDTNNFQRNPRVRGSRIVGADTIDPYGYIDIPYFMVAVDLGTFTKLPLTVQIAADPGNNSGMNSGAGNDSRNDFDYIKMNGSVRISGERIADLLTFDAIYRFKGGDPNTINSYDEDYFPGGVIQPDGLGITAHIFGVYANILNVSNFGIGLGYSGYTKIFEEDRDSTVFIINRNGPLHNGIDLRLQYTGINKLTITSANNFSFASVKRSTEDPQWAIGVLGTPLPTGTSQRWIAIYNSIGLDYELSDQLKASLQIGNRYGVIETVEAPLSGGSVTYKRSRMQFGGGMYVGYQLNDNFYLQAGMMFRFLNDSYSNNDPRITVQNNPETRNAGGGMFDFAVPIRMRIVIGNK